MRAGGRALQVVPLLTLLAVGCSRPDPGPFRHVVLISLDTTRADHLDPYGATRPTTPRIAALAEAGVLFEHVLSPAPTTLAAHTSIMTGCYPQSHGVARNGFNVNPANVMLAELLADEGFHTAGFLGSWALHSSFDFNQGFDTFDESFDVLVGAERGGGHDQDQRDARQVTDALLSHVDRVEAERMFLFAHYFDAHQPYEPPAPHGASFRSPGDLEQAGDSHLGRAVAERVESILGQPLSVSQLITHGLFRPLIEQADGEPRGLDRQLANLYAGEVAYIDQQIARLLAGLNTRGILEDALVILTGDHGETFWEHGDAWNHGLWVYDTTVRVPLILCFPDGRGAGTRVTAPVSTIDIVPTLCDLLGLARPARVQGMSLVPALAGGAFERGPVYTQATQPLSRAVELTGPWPNLLKPRAVRRGRWKYVQAPYLSSRERRPQVMLASAGLEQLFDLQTDPGEQVNLLRSDLDPGAAAALESLRGQLEAWAASADPLPSAFNSGQSAEILRRLDGLGYVGSDEEQDEEQDEENGDEDR
ncbi:MAG: arylsulfatase [Gammaproteobacteria bacterium]|jgi:arylsulfatase